MLVVADIMKRIAIIAPILTLLLCGLLYFTGIVGSSRARVERDHSIKLPSFASEITCAPFISLSWLWDSGESASFLMLQKDLDDVIRQLNDTKISAEGLRGVSKDGNIVAISIEERSNGKLRVTINTSWN